MSLPQLRAMGAGLTKAGAAGLTPQTLTALGTDSAAAATVAYRSTDGGVTWSSLGSFTTALGSANGLGVGKGAGAKSGSTYMFMTTASSVSYLVTTTNWSTFSLSGSVSTALMRSNPAFNGSAVVVGRSTGISNYSADFTNWTASAAIGSGNNFYSLAYIPSTDQYMAVGSGSSPNGAASFLLSATSVASAGSTWSRTSMSTPATNAAAFSVAAGNNVVMVSGLTGGAAGTLYTWTYNPSTTTWTANGSVSSTTVGAGTGPFSLAFGSPSAGTNRWVVSSDGNSSTPFYYSDNNGSSWTACSGLGANTSGGNYNHVVWANRFVACGDSTNGQIIYSTDGITWSASSTTFPSTTIFTTLIVG